MGIPTPIEVPKPDKSTNPKEGLGQWSLLIPTGMPDPNEGTNSHGGSQPNGGS